VFALLFSVGLEAQMADPTGMSAGRLKKIAANAEMYGDSYSALRFYKAYAEKKEKKADVQFHLAELYEETRDYAKAEPAYLKAYELDHSNAEALYGHARMVKMNGDPKKALRLFEEFYDLIRDNGYDSSWRRRIREEKKSAETALELLEDTVNAEINLLNGDINGPHAEFSPIPFGENEILFGSLRENEITYYHVDSSTVKRRIYKAVKNGDTWENSGLWPVPFNAGDEHFVNGTFNKESDLFIFTKCQENWKNEMECALWLSRKKDGEWQQAVKMNEEINVAGAIITQPALAFEQRRERDVLYYSSNQADGRGGMDIWYTYYDDRRESWREPRNLGRRVNGTGDEITPYYNRKEKKLYFSSNSHEGLGGLDIYSARGELRRFSTPENIGYPLNSSVDELYYSLRDDRESGFFVSNRKGGFQMINETCCDDIYEFKLRDVIHIEMEGFVMQVDEEDYVEGAGDKLSANSFNTNFLDAVKVRLYLIEDSGEVLMDQVTTNADGRYKMDFEPGKEYRVNLSRPGFFSNSIDLDTRDITESKTIKQNVGLSEMSENSIRMKNILYEFDSSELTADSKNKLRTGALNILRENPSIIVEISSHTDNKGEAGYNEQLSQKRAESVVNFLTSQGIDRSRLKAKGYGEAQPIADNKNADGTDNPEGRAMNRRTDFKIIGENQNASPSSDEAED
jgi:outer membrane protein OmpA-like peptidoglycan-associated protein/tetratricopeptide (TPR) repeat protein